MTKVFFNDTNSRKSYKELEERFCVERGTKFKELDESSLENDKYMAGMLIADKLTDYLKNIRRYEFDSVDSEIEFLKMFIRVVMSTSLTGLNVGLEFMGVDTQMDLNIHRIYIVDANNRDNSDMAVVKVGFVRAENGTSKYRYSHPETLPPKYKEIRESRIYLARIKQQIGRKLSKMAVCSEQTKGYIKKEIQELEDEYSRVHHRVKIFETAARMGIFNAIYISGGQKIG